MLNLEDFKAIIFKNKELKITPDEKRDVDESFLFLSRFAKNKIIYGINTGFGPMAQYRVSDKDIKNLQYNIIRSHSSGAGKPLEEIYVKAAMLCRYITFIMGKSGVHFDSVEILRNFINKNIIPYIPEHGSVGASGDLVQQSHVALALIGEGEVFYKGEKRNCAEVLKKENLQPMAVHMREGLALANGSAFMTGIGLINLIFSRKLFNIAIIMSALINEIASSFDDFISFELNNTKLHYGQQKTAEFMRQLLMGSQCLRCRKTELYEKKCDDLIFQNKIQSEYSLRCVPQILGPIYDEIQNAKKVLINELNSIDDNPIIDSENKSVFHGGNFHGDYVAFEMDKLKIGITKLTMLIERHLNYLLNNKINGILPPFINLGNIGLNYGIQGMQFTATSTTAECQTLSNPMYVHSIPNNNDNQDIVSMGTNAALITKIVIDNSFQVLAINAIALAQAVDYLKIEPLLAPKTREFYRQVRSVVPLFVEDTPKYKEIEEIVKFFKEI